MRISVVIPLLNEQENIRTLCRELTDVLSTAAEGDYEILFVDDGSTDDTFAVLSDLHAADRHVRVIQFRRNFGKSAALAAGFASAQSDVIFTVDGDLQDNPAEIPRFLKKLDEGYDLVSGWKYPRHDPISKTLPSKLFNLVTRVVTGIKLHDFNCGFKAYRREVVEDIRLYGELHRYIPILARQKGYRVAEIQVAHRRRNSGESKYGVSRFARGFFDFLTVFFLTEYGWRPLHLFGWMGLIAFLSGFVISLYLTGLWIADRGPIGNRPLLTLGVLLIIIGVQFFSIGLLAEMFTSALSKDDATYSIKRRLD